MCGRFAFYSPDEAITHLFGVTDAPDIVPRYNLAPTQFVPAIRVADDDRRVSLLHWGLVPFWAKDKKIGNRMINARAETLAEKPAFRAAFKRRRCLVLADGFYEWQKVDGGKVPHFIYATDGNPFAMAGLWERWKPKDDPDAEPLESCTIVTTGANAFMKPLHHRMPAILMPDDYEAWLDPANEDNASLASMLGPARDGMLAAHAVSKRVNSPANDDAALIEADEAG